MPIVEEAVILKRKYKVLVIHFQSKYIKWICSLSSTLTCTCAGRLSGEKLNEIKQRTSSALVTPDTAAREHNGLCRGKREGAKDRKGKKEGEKARGWERDTKTFFVPFSCSLLWRQRMAAFHWVLSVP